MLKKTLIILIVIIVLLGGILGYGLWSATKLPVNSPETFLKSHSKRGEQVVVCIGDSITHGQVSHNYVDELAKRYPPRKVTFINAGINSELAYNVRQRIDEIIRCQPDVITILIGSNDALATLNPENAARYVKERGLPRTPDKEWYARNLSAGVNRLQAETQARIALLSLPPITEDTSHAGYKRAIEYSAVVRQIAMEENLTYLPLNEQMVDVIAKKPVIKESDYKGGDRMGLYTAIISYYLLGRDWDEIADDNGFLFLTDSIHLNGRGAKIVADLISLFLQNKGD